MRRVGSTTRRGGLRRRRGARTAPWRRRGPRLVRVLRDHGQRGEQQFRERDVVEADVADALAHAALVQRAQDADRDEVLGREDRGRRLGADRAARAPRRGRRRSSSPTRRSASRSAIPWRPGARSGSPRAARRWGTARGRSPRKAIRRWPAATRCVTASAEPPRVVAHDRVGLQPARRAGRRTPAARPRRARAPGSGGRGRRARSAARRRGARRTPPRGRARAGRRRPSCPRRCRKRRSREKSSTPRCTQREERVGDVLDDDPDAGRDAPGAPQRARRLVALVAEQLDRVADLRRQILAHRDVAVDRPRDGR